MGFITALTLTIIGSNMAVMAQSSLFDKVKDNPSEAKSMCNQFRALNKKGISISSKEVIQDISQKRNLNISDAEILTIYVAGMHCSEVY